MFFRTDKTNPIPTNSNAKKPEDLPGDYKIILLGDSNTGKTTLISQFMKKSLNDIQPTLGLDFHTAHITLEAGNKAKFLIWDTAGSERFQSISKQYYRNADACIYVCDATDQKSLDHIPEWVQQTSDNTGMAKYLVCNKSDRDYKLTKSPEELERYAQSNGFDGFFMTSALKNSNVQLTFQSVANSAIEKEKIAKHSAKLNTDVVKLGDSEPGKNQPQDDSCCGGPKPK